MVSPPAGGVNKFSKESSVDAQYTRVTDRQTEVISIAER